jgi:hypothetical protein
VAHLPVTDRAAAELIRLPLYIDLTIDEQDAVIDAVGSVLAPKLAKRRPATPRVMPIAPRHPATPAAARLAP